MEEYISTIYNFTNNSNNDSSDYYYNKYKIIETN